MAQRVKYAAPKPGHLSVIPEPTEDGENQLLKLSSDPRMWLKYQGLCFTPTNNSNQSINQSIKAINKRKALDGVGNRLRKGRHTRQIPHGFTLMI